MGVQVYGRRAIRRFERETGEQIVHAVNLGGTILTTRDHRHLAWTGEQWTELEQSDGGNDNPWPACGLATRLSSCSLLFGEAKHGVHRGFMEGPCSTCGVDCSQLHRADCSKLATILALPSVNPDYWPRPVHRPLWLDDDRCPSTPGALRMRLFYTLAVPIEAMTQGAHLNHWAYWEGAGREAVEQFRQSVALVAPDLLRAHGLDPERYTLTFNDEPVSPWDPWRREESP